MATTTPRGERRERILASATSLFEENGFHGAGIDDIAAAAGVTGPAIYRHFKNKDAVLVALFDTLAAQLRGILDAVAARQGRGGPTCPTTSGAPPSTPPSACSTPPANAARSAFPGARPRTCWLAWRSSRSSRHEPP